MKQVSEQEIQNAVTSVVYKNVLGLTRPELIAKAKKIAGSEWGFIAWDSDDEKARDWLSSESLRVLADTENIIHMALFLARPKIKGIEDIIAIVNKHSQGKTVSKIWD